MNFLYSKEILYGKNYYLLLIDLECFSNIFMNALCLELFFDGLWANSNFLKFISL